MKSLSILTLLLFLPMTAGFARNGPQTPQRGRAEVVVAKPVTADPSSPTQALVASSGGCFGGEFTVEFDTVPECNCTGRAGVISICHQEKVEVEVGGWPVSVLTGKSTTSCFRQSVSSGTCLFYRYKLRCCDRALFGYTCRFVESQSRQSSSTCS